MYCLNHLWSLANEATNGALSIDLWSW
jgi:hypothetical protein